MLTKYLATNWKKLPVKKKLAVNLRDVWRETIHHKAACLWQENNCMQHSNKAVQNN